MRTALLTKTAPQPFVTKEDVKVQLKIASGDTSKDALIDTLLAGVCGYLDGPDGALKRGVAAQTLVLVLPSFFPGGQCLPHRIELPLPPLRSITAIKYFDVSGTEQTLDPSAWRVINRGTERSRIVPTGSWPATQSREDAVNIEYVAGYGDGGGQEKMPVQLKQAVILMVRQLYDLGERNVFVTGQTTFGVGSKTYAVSDAAAKVIERAVDSLLFNVRMTG